MADPYRTPGMPLDHSRAKVTPVEAVIPKPRSVPRCCPLCWATWCEDKAMCPRCGATEEGLASRRSEPVDQDTVPTIPAPAPPADTPAGKMLAAIALGEVPIEPDTEAERKVLRGLVRNRLAEWQWGAGFTLTKAGLEALVRYEIERGRFGVPR